MDRISPTEAGRALPADDDLFTSFAAAGSAPMDDVEQPLAAPEAYGLTQRNQPARRRTSPQAVVPAQQQQPGSPLARLPMVTWLLLAGAGLVIVTAMIYYWRRRQTTQGREREDKNAIGEALRALTAQVSVLEQQQESVMQQQTVLAQQHNTLAGQLRSVAAHSRSVEQGLGQALESWTATIQQLREEFELLVEDDEEADGNAAGAAAAGASPIHTTGPDAHEEDDGAELEGQSPARA
jgi:hypothetical protein